MTQVEKGWLSPPVQHKADGRPCEWRLRGYNIAFRFGVEQAEKLRACGDLKHILSNLSCSVATPIKLVSWGRLAQLNQTLAKGGVEWGMFRADHEAYYKQLRIDPEALRRPKSGKRFGFATRTPVFGAVAAVLHYNVSPAIGKL